MNILMISCDYFPKVGGISIMSHHLANAFVSGGNRVLMLAPKDATLIDGFVANYTLFVDADSRVKERSGRSGKQEFYRIRKLLVELKTRFDYDRIILVHPFYYGPAAVSVAKRQGIPCSNFFHGFELKSQLVIRSPLWKRAIAAITGYRTLSQYTLGVLFRASEVLVNSSVTGKLVEQAGRKDYLVTGCGLDEDSVTEHLTPLAQKPVWASKLKKQLDLKGRYLIGFAGRLVESKNVGFIIELLNHVEQVDLVIVGTGPLERSIQDRVEQLGLQNRVRFMGYVSEERKWEILKAIDMLLLPSVMLPSGQMEGFGIVLLEATICGAMVAVSRYGGMGDFVLDNNGAYINVHDAKGSANVIASFLDQPNERARRVYNAQKLIEERLTYKKIATDLVNRWASNGRS